MDESTVCIADKKDNVEIKIWQIHMAEKRIFLIADKKYILLKWNYKKNIFLNKIMADTKETLELKLWRIKSYCWNESMAIGL